MINGWTNSVTYNEALEWDNNEYQYIAYQREIKRLCDSYNNNPHHKGDSDFRPWLEKRLAAFLRRNGARKTANYREIAAAFVDCAITAEFWRLTHPEE